MVRIARVRRLRARRPAQRQAHRFRRLIVCRRVGRAFIELHDDVGIERALHLHRALRREEHLAAIDRRAEACAFFGQLADFGEAEHLKAAGIGENRLVPVHELVQATVGGDDVFAGAQHQVEGVAEDDFRAERVQLLRRKPLDRAEGADRHEHRRFHRLPVGESNAAAPRATVLGNKLILHDKKGNVPKWMLRCGAAFS